MKKYAVLAIAIIFVLGMVNVLAAAEEPTYVDDVPTYEDGVLTMTLEEGNCGAQVVKIRDGEIIENGAPSMILIMKLRNSPDGSGMKVIELTIHDVGPGENEPFPETIVINIVGDPNEIGIDTSIVVLEKIRGEQIEPSTIIPEIVILEKIRGEQIEPSIVNPDVINN